MYMYILMCYFESRITHSIYRVRLQVEKLLPNLGNPPISAICALTGFGVETLMHEVASANNRWRRRIPTGLLNSWLRRVERVRYYVTIFSSWLWIISALVLLYVILLIIVSKIFNLRRTPEPHKIYWQLLLLLLTT